MTVEKNDIERMVGQHIPQDVFEEALLMASMKQDYLYENDRRPVIKEEWYLQQLTAEYVEGLWLTALCERLNAYNMEKEHRHEQHGTPHNTHIVASTQQ